ncbi:MAG: DUF1499 domain-containing protein [Planctomycetota bacterium]|nr:DUF1499 domain-containing protein [Planctomycetota bacterium]
MAVNRPAPESSEEHGHDRPRVVDTITQTGKMPPFFVILAGIVLTVLTVICLQVDDWSRDWTNNSAETDPESDDVNMRPIESGLSPDEFGKLMIESMKKVPRWEIVETVNLSDELVKIHLLHRTFFVGFKDDIHVEIVATEEGSTLYARSDSRIGSGDLGQNPRNLRELISTVRGDLE